MARECRLRRTCQLCGEDEDQINAANETAAEAQERTGVMELYLCHGVSGALFSKRGRYQDGNRIGVRDL